MVEQTLCQRPLRLPRLVMFCSNGVRCAVTFLINVWIVVGVRVVPCVPLVTCPLFNFISLYKHFIILYKYLPTNAILFQSTPTPK